MSAPRYTVVKVDRPPDPDFHRPRHGPGWRIHDANPPMIQGDDVEGIGWVVFNPLRRGSPLIGWFARKRDAIDICLDETGILRQCFGDFRGRDIFAFPAKRVSDPVDKIEKAALVLAHQIAGAEPGIARLEDVA